MKPTEFVTELSNDALARYKEKAKKSADELTAAGKHRQATDRWGNVMKATGKQIEKTTKNIRHSMATEDEQLDGMALGELKAIVQDAKKIYQHVKSGTPLEAWMYKKITNSNESLTAVAQQIDNPAIREPEGVAEEVDLGQYDAVKSTHKGQTTPEQEKSFREKVQQYAKELEQRQKEKGVAEGHADQQRKIFKKNGKPVGEVGIDRESSPGNGQWYMKCYAYNIDNAGYDSYEEAVEELKYCLKQGVAEEVDTGEYDARKSTHKGNPTKEQEKSFHEKVKQYGDELEQRQKEKEQTVKEGQEDLDAILRIIKK